MRLTARYHFAASHRLATEALSPEENQRLYGKCNNPYGHGHDYTLEVSVEGPIAAGGQILNRQDLDRLVEEHVLARLDHRDLNTDVSEFAGRVTTTENLTAVIRAQLERHWTLQPRLAGLRISETARNTFGWKNQAPPAMAGSLPSKVHN
jgi:6-pyruvoyltetrahydropterin/6-carboxytetrahydropterin synthase